MTAPSGRSVPDPAVARIATRLGDWAAKRVAIQCVWLFGSRTGDAYRPDSDLDIALTLFGERPEAVRTFERYKREWMSSMRRFVPYRVDLQLADLESEASRAALRAGLLVYARPGCDCTAALTPPPAD